MAPGFVSHLDLNVSDPVASTAFYGIVLGALGFEEEPIDDAGRTQWSLTYEDDSIFGIEVRSPREPAPRSHHERHAPGLDHLALQAASRHDVDRVAELLAHAGHRVADPPTDYDYSPGYYATAFDDPDGIRIEVVHDPTRDTVPTPVTITHLEMAARPTINRSKDELAVGQLLTPAPELNRFFYESVGRDWQWHSRLPWDLDQWREAVAKPGAETWVATVDSVPVGYFELQADSVTTEIRSFGLLPHAIGCGLGPQLLRAALEKAWRHRRVERVILNTCTLDHPRALPNYLAAGFAIERTDEIIDHIPRRLVS